MSSHRLQKDWKARLKSVVSFGLGWTKPKHFREMFGVAWRNRDNPGYAWKVLEGKVLLSPVAHDTLQIYWSEGNVIIRQGVTDPLSGVPDYNAPITVEKIPDNIR